MDRVILVQFTAWIMALYRLSDDLFIFLLVDDSSLDFQFEIHLIAFFGYPLYYILLRELWSTIWNCILLSECVLLRSCKSGLFLLHVDARANVWTTFLKVWPYAFGCFSLTCYLWFSVCHLLLELFSTFEASCVILVRTDLEILCALHGWYIIWSVSILR